MKQRIPDGFTLLELLISLSILSLITVLVFAALRIGSQAWEKGEQDIENRHRQRVVMELIRRQLSAICLRNMLDNGKKAVFLSGDQAVMHFLSDISLVPGKGERVVSVHYRIIPDDHQKNKALYQKAQIFRDKLGKPQKAILLYELLQAKDTTGTWKEVVEQEIQKMKQ